MSVLIVTMPNDYHAHAVKWAIERIGGRCELFYALDLCDGAGWSFDPEADFLHIDYKGKRETLAFNDFQSVWMRRPGGIYAQETITDMKERAVSEAECLVYASSIISSLETDRFTVNPNNRNRLAAQKPFQLTVAARIGMTMPKTLISNSKHDILDFFHSCGKRIVYKALKPSVWKVQDGKFSMTPTTILSDTDLLLHTDLSRSPSIFQEVIKKKVEIRATVMGRSIFAWEKSFSSREDLDVDWRYMYKEATHKIHILPDYLAQKCFQLMDALGLVFGCFDFIIDENGRYLFLEVNPQGQWLWGDGLEIGLYQLEAMAEFLLSGNPEFKYSENNGFKLSDYSGDDYNNSVEEEKTHHYGDLTTTKYERVSLPMLDFGTVNLGEPVAVV